MMAKVAIAGATGIVGSLLANYLINGCLDGSNTSLKLVSTSEIKITLVVESSLENTTIESLHKEFFK